MTFDLPKRNPHDNCMTFDLHKISFYFGRVKGRFSSGQVKRSYMAGAGLYIGIIMRKEGQSGIEVSCNQL